MKAFFNVKSIALLVVGSIIFGVGAQCFVSPANIAPGGAVGVAMMLNYLFGVPIGMMTLCINIPLLLMAWKYLSHGLAYRTTVACAISSVVIDFLIAPNLPEYTGDKMLGSLYGGILIGVGMAFIFLSGCTTGGTDIVGYLMQKKMPQIPIGRALLIIDGIVLSVSIVVFKEVDAALFGLICLYAETKVIDTIIYGSDTGSKVTIISKHPEEIANRIITDLDRTATIFHGQGAYSGNKENILVVAVRKSEFDTLKNLIHECDENAFVMVTETSQVYGLGFKDFVNELTNV